MENREKQALHNVDSNVTRLGNSLDDFEMEITRKLTRIEQNQATILANQQTLANNQQTILNELRKK